MDNGTCYFIIDIEIFDTNETWVILLFILLWHNVIVTLVVKLGKRKVIVLTILILFVLSKLSSYLICV